ncbi:MAG: radical SAM protein [Kiritimatiellae bacterium]|nr:radical SAM protein [Kiritimatiellia bacterium]
MNEQRESDVPIDKSYSMPSFKLVKYNGCGLAVFVDIARWVVLRNDRQQVIFNELTNGRSIGNVLEGHSDSINDVREVLVQLEALQVEKIKAKSIFSNTRLHLHLTNRCNMHCPHCYVCSSVAYDNELTTEEIQSLCKHFRDIGGTDVSLTGGEPTLRDDFFEIVKYISDIGMRVSVYTNGLNWDEEKIKRLATYSIEGVQVSIDGYDEQTNAVFRNKGAFERALNTVDLMLKHKLHLKIAITPPYEVLMENRQKYIDFAKSLLDKYGTDSLELNFSYALMPGRELTVAFVDSVRDKYQDYIDKIVSSVWPNAKMDSFVANISDGIYDSCGYGGLNVLSNGDLYFCDRLSDVAKNGNIRDMPFEEIHRLMQLAEETGKIDHFRPCKDCELKYICGGGCRAEWFRQFTQIDNVEEVDYTSIAPRKCTYSDKERIYDLMLRTTEMFYR